MHPQNWTVSRKSTESSKGARSWPPIHANTLPSSSTAQFKAKVVLEVLQGEKSPADACRTYKLHNSILTRWKREFLEHSHQVFEVPQQVAQEAGKVAELERMATARETLLEKQGVAIGMAEIGEPTQNGYAERLMQTIKEEEVDLSEYRNIETSSHQSRQCFLLPLSSPIANR